MRIAGAKQICSPETRAKRATRMLGSKNPNYGKGTMTGRTHSEASKQKTRIALMGHPVSDATRRKMSQAAQYGENHPRWRGGVSKYIREWKRMAASIRKRDGYCCVLCGAKSGEAALDVHHIDLHKYNNADSNLITLCRTCHIGRVHRSSDSEQTYESAFKLNISQPGSPGQTGQVDTAAQQGAQ